MQLKDIKRLYRLYMNGIVSQSMRNKGVEYRVNFGLTLPLLRRIAEQIPPSTQIAEELWQDRGVRESLLLAPMVYPTEQCTPDTAQRWVENIPNIEVADFCCKYLFSHLPYAPQLAGNWIEASQQLIVYTAFRLGYALLPDINDEAWLRQISKKAIETSQATDAVAASAARRFLTEALLLPTAGKIVVEQLQETENIDTRWKENLIALYMPEC